MGSRVLSLHHPPSRTLLSSFHSFIHSLVHSPLIHSFIHSFIHSCTHSFICGSVRSFVHSPFRILTNEQLPLPRADWMKGSSRARSRSSPEVLTPVMEEEAELSAELTRSCSASAGKQEDQLRQPADPAPVVLKSPCPFASKLQQVLAARKQGSHRGWPRAGVCVCWGQGGGGQASSSLLMSLERAGGIVLFSASSQLS